MRHRRLCCALLVPVWIVACGGGGSGTTAPPPPGPQPSAAVTVQGHFLGETDLPGETLFVEALVAEDGEARMNVSSFLWDRAVLEGGGGPTSDLVKPTESMQFVGSAVFSQFHADGHGVVLGQDCTLSPPGRFCDAPVDASLSYDVSDSGVLTGNLRVSAPSGIENWSLRLRQWGTSDPRGGSAPNGVFREELAPFAAANDVSVTFDRGQMSFRSAATGCVGHGTLTPHLDVTDVVLLITDCAAPYALLNGEFQGLETASQSGYWDYDGSWIVIFLAAPDGAPPRPALTMRAHLE